MFDVRSSIRRVSGAAVVIISTLEDLIGDSSIHNYSEQTPATFQGMTQSYHFL